MTNSFLDKAGLTYLWSKITALVNTKQNTLTFDSTPTANSTNPVTSAGIKAYVDENAGGGGDSPVESGTGVGSVQTKAYSDSGVTYTQLASGRGAFAEGSGTRAKNTSSHAEGISTMANGIASHSEGYAVTYKQITLTCTSRTATTLTYTGSVDSNDVGNYVYCASFQNGSLQKITAVNTSSNTITIANAPYATLTNATAYIIHHGTFGSASHCEGADSISVGDYSHSEGYGTVAQGTRSHAEGYYTIANGISQHVEGKFNVADTANMYAHITGVGDSASSRRNGFTVDWNGNGVFYGKVSVGNSYSASTDNDLITKGFFDRETAPTILEESTDVDNYGVYPICADPDVTWSGHFLICYDSEVEGYIGYESWDSPPAFSKIVLQITQPSTHGGSDDDTIYLPLTKYAEFYVQDIPGNFQRMVFGNNERVYVADESGHFFLESEYPYPSGS